LKVRWLRQALRDLDGEAVDIARDDERAALLVVRRILEAVAKLLQEPGLGHPGRVPGTRELVVRGTSHIVPYRAVRQEIQLLRVFHTARRPPKDWR
jgi:plasmid stabilization system protein ParE